MCSCRNNFTRTVLKALIDRGFTGLSRSAVCLMVVVLLKSFYLFLLFLCQYDHRRHNAIMGFRSFATRLLSCCDDQVQPPRMVIVSGMVPCPSLHLTHYTSHATIHKPLSGTDPTFTGLTLRFHPRRRRRNPRRSQCSRKVTFTHPKHRHRSFPGQSSSSRQHIERAEHAPSAC